MAHNILPLFPFLFYPLDFPAFFFLSTARPLCQVKEFAPNMYNALMTDPNMKKYMEDPFKAVEEGKELLRNFQNR